MDMTCDGDQFENDIDPDLSTHEDQLVHDGKRVRTERGGTKLLLAKKT
jgi:hypothetical protein